MTHVAKVFMNGRSKAVRLPASYNIDCKEMYMRQDPATGDVILSRKPPNWDRFNALVKDLVVPDDFLSEKELDRGEPDDRDPFAGWAE